MTMTLISFLYLGVALFAFGALGYLFGRVIFDGPPSASDSIESLEEAKAETEQERLKRKADTDLWKGIVDEWKARVQKAKAEIVKLQNEVKEVERAAEDRTARHLARIENLIHVRNCLVADKDTLLMTLGKALEATRGVANALELPSILPGDRKMNPQVITPETIDERIRKEWSDKLSGWKVNWSDGEPFYESTPDPTPHPDCAGLDTLKTASENLLKFGEEELNVTNDLLKMARECGTPENDGWFEFDYARIEDRMRAAESTFAVAYGPEEAGTIYDADPRNGSVPGVGRAMEYDLDDPNALTVSIKGLAPEEGEELLDAIIDVFKATVRMSAEAEPDDEGPEGEDGPWAEGWAERSGETEGEPGKFYTNQDRGDGGEPMGLEKDIEPPRDYRLLDPDEKTQTDDLFTDGIPEADGSIKWLTVLRLRAGNQSEGYTYARKVELPDGCRYLKEGEAVEAGDLYRYETADRWIPVLVPRSDGKQLDRYRYARRLTKPVFHVPAGCRLLSDTEPLKKGDFYQPLSARKLWRAISSDEPKRREGYRYARKYENDTIELSGATNGRWNPDSEREQEAMEQEAIADQIATEEYREEHFGTDS